MKKLAVLGLILALVGCASKTQTMLNNRINHMSYEEAIQRFGPPTQCADAGATRVCRWMDGGGGSVQIPLYGNVWNMPIRGHDLQLTFVNDRLTHWRCSHC